jgi:hypothetical protein
MKPFSKIVNILALGLVLSLLSAVSVFASDVKVNTVDATAVGENVEFTVKAVDCTYISGGTLFITYDNTKLKPVSFTAGELGDGTYTAGKLDYADNKCSFVFACADSIPSVDTLVTFTFQATSVGKAYISLDSNSVISDVNLLSVEYSITGDKVAYIGMFVGDVDKDSILTANDAAAVLQYVLDSDFDVAGNYNFTVGDVDKDGLESANDAACILQTVLGTS